MSPSDHVRDRLQAIEERLARLRAEKGRLVERADKAARRLDARRKIVIGGTVLAALEHGGVPALATRADLLAWLEARLTRPADRHAFDLKVKQTA